MPESPAAAANAVATVRGRVAIGAVWALSLVASFAVLAAWHGPGVTTYLAVVLALSVVAGFVGQLVVGEQQGFVLRLAAACSGAFVVVGLAALAALLQLPPA